MGGRRAGFTMLELVIVIAIMAVLSTVGFVSLSGFRGKQNLKKTTDELVAVIVGTQKRSISQDAGNRWNIRFSNTTSSGSQYIVFSGTTYATSAIDRTYGLNRGIVFSEPYSSSTFDAFFAPFTGTLPSKKIISMVTGRQDGFVGDILLNTVGRVEGRIESGLVGYWHFDENTSTTVYDASGFGNNGVLVNTPTWQTGTNCISGSCLNFVNTSSQYVNVTNIPNLPSFTMSAWVNGSAAGYEAIARVIDGSSYGFEIDTAPAGTLRARFDTSSLTNQVVSNTQNVKDGAWHHVALTYDASSKAGIVYADGIASSPLTITGTLPTTFSETRIAYLGWGNYWNGKIDEVRIYNRALSATEILNMYNDLK